LNCGAAEYVPVWENVPDRLLRLGGRFDYGTCAACHLLQIRRVPGDLPKWYSGYERHDRESPVYAFFRQAVTKRCYAFPRCPGARLLDIGCGNGWYMQAMSRRGWLVTGHELDPGYAERLQEQTGLRVISGLQQLKRLSNRFDLATFNFSFEHLAEPRQTLEAVAGALKPGAMVVIQVPNVEGWEAHLFKRRWFHLDAPRDITFYTKAQLAGLVAEMGFERVTISNVPVATGFAGSLSYTIFGHLHPFVWYPAILPGTLFSLLIRDGIFRVSAVKTH